MAEIAISAIKMDLQTKQKKTHANFVATLKYVEVIATLEEKCLCNMEKE